jgi:dolichol-phosphate mannosyltransferase
VYLRKSGFEVETELTVDTLAKGFSIVEVPITYRKRGGKTKLNPIRDGIRIAATINELLRHYSPGRYFYFIGLSLVLIGVLMGIYVTLEWLKNISHDLLAILTTLLIIAGLQILVFGIISDFVFRSSSQMRRELISVKNELRRMRELNGKKMESEKDRGII